MRTGAAESNQSAVWDDVDGCLQSLGVESETESLIDGYEAAKNKLKTYRKNISLPKGAAGVIVCGGNRVIGMDLFDSPKTFKKLWPRLSDAYFIEAAAFAKKRAKTSKNMAKRFIESLPGYMSPTDSRLGMGTELDITGPEITGSALWNEGRLYHLSAFTKVC